MWRSIKQIYFNTLLFGINFNYFNFKRAKHSKIFYKQNSIWQYCFSFQSLYQSSSLFTLTSMAILWSKLKYSIWFWKSHRSKAGVEINSSIQHSKSIYSDGFLLFKVFQKYFRFGYRFSFRGFIFHSAWTPTKTYWKQWNQRSIFSVER